VAKADKKFPLFEGFGLSELFFSKLAELIDTETLVHKKPVKFLGIQVC
jgi:hypothetical protein